MNNSLQIYGAGSIGNHLAHAARQLDFDVEVVDKSFEALKRMEKEIYPSRYNSFDKKIKLKTLDKAIKEKKYFDYIFIGTPPDTHLDLAIENLLKKPKAIMIEKPLCTPSLKKLNFLKEKMKVSKSKMFIGYDHSVALSFKHFINLAKTNIGQVSTIDVDFRENWIGILKAHPWLNGAHETYLGFTKRGGGALCEHSHGLHLWLTIAKQLKLGEVFFDKATIKTERNNELYYDKITHLHLKSGDNVFGRVVQDVIGIPPYKKILIQGTLGYVEWHCAKPKIGDLVVLHTEDNKVKEFVYSKNRPDDFITEIKHITNIVENGGYEKSPLNINMGIKTMEIINLAFKKNGFKEFL